MRLLPITSRPLRRPAGQILAATLFAFAAVGAARGEETAAAELRAVAEVRALAVHPAADRPAVPPGAVRIEGVVTFVHPTNGEFFVQDRSGGVLVGRANERQALPSVGARVTVVGSVEATESAPRLRAAEITVHGPGERPAPRVITVAEGRGGRADGVWVELRGRLAQVRSADGWLNLTVADADGDFSVSIPTAQGWNAALGAPVRVRGVCNVWRTGFSRKIGGFFLFAPSLAEVELLGERDEPGQPLDTVRAVLRLRADEADDARAVVLRGVVTFAHPDQRLFYLHDGTGGVLVWMGAKDAPLPAVGTTVRVRGATSFGTFSATVRATAVEAGEPRAWPEPRATSFGQALTGAEDGQWIELRGHLRQVDAAAGWLRLALTTGAGDFTVSVPGATTIDAQVGSYLVVRGVCQVWLDERFRIGGVFLYTPSVAHVVVAGPPPSDPFAVPEEAIANLHRYRSQTLQQQQVRLRGTVLHHLPGRHLVVENASGVVRALSRGTEPLRPGDQVEVAGVPGLQGERTLLRGAVYRRLAGGAAPEPRTLAGDLAPAPALEGKLVTVTGTVVGVARRAADTRLLVQTERPLLEAFLPGEFPAGAAAWRPGSTVAVTGLYTVEYDDEEHPLRVAIELRAATDVAVLAAPGWWTLGRALTALGVLAGGLAAGLIWVLSLRRQVRRQTAVIREQVRKEAELEARHGEIVRSASDFIFSTDREGRFTAFNPAGERLTGFTRDAALALRLHELLDPADAAASANLAALAQRVDDGAGAAPPVEWRFRTRDGRTLWLETSVRPLLEDGRVTGLLGIARDVTARKQAEEQQRRLEAMHRHVQKTESLGRMAGAIAHHFNNQLQAVLMSLQLTREDLPRDSEAVGFLESALQSTRRAAEMSSLMLTYLGQTPGDRVVLELAEWCRGALPAQRARWPQGVTLVENLPSPGPRVRAVRGQLGRILAACVENAVESRRGATVEVRVTVGAVGVAQLPTTHRYPRDFEPTAAEYAFLEIADDGAGIPEADFDKLFDPFFTTKATGRGMGLPVALGVTRAHDGAIVLASTPGRGSAFRFVFPVAG